MSKALYRPQRQFGINIKNSLQEQEVEQKLALKPKSRKKVQPMLFNLNSPSRPQMNYFDEVMKYALTTVSYPHILKGPQKVKRDIEALLHQVTAINGNNCIWHQNFLNKGISEDSFFYNKELTLEKRTALIDWIIAIHRKYTLREETLFLAIKLTDQYCEKNDVQLKQYQLVGITALFMATKFVEIQLPKFKDYHRLIDGQFTAEEMIETESQILCKTHFLLSRKISSLWYLQAFAIQQIIFPPQPKYFKTDKTSEPKDNRSTATKENQQPEQKFQKFMHFARYILNLIQLDYKITTKYKEDIVAIASLLFTTIQKDFLDAEAKTLMRFFIETKSRLIEQNQTPEEIAKIVKKCMKKIQNLYAKRDEKRFETINQKFDRKGHK